MDFRQLQTFIAIAEAGGFNRAAKTLHFSQSSISRRISLLEHELGQQLFLRDGKRVVLTAIGETLAREGRLILRQIRLAEAELSQVTNLQGGEFCMGAGIDDCVGLLPPILRQFCEKFPKVDVKVVATQTSEILSGITDGRIDLGFITLPIVTGNLTVKKLFTEELVVACSHDHAWRQRGRVNAAELEDFPLILIAKESITRQILDRFFNDFGLRPRVAMEFPTFEPVQAMVAMNLGIGILPLGIGTGERGLHILRIKETRLKRDRGLVYLKSESLPGVVSQMVNLFLQRFRERKPTKPSSVRH